MKLLKTYHKCMAFGCAVLAGYCYLSGDAPETVLLLPFFYYGASRLPHLLCFWLGLREL